MPAPGLYKCPRCDGGLKLIDGHWAVNTYRCESCSKPVIETETGKVFVGGQNDLSFRERDAPIPSKETKNHRSEKSDKAVSEKTLGWLAELGIGEVRLGEAFTVKWDPSDFENECRIVFRMLARLASEQGVDLPPAEGKFKSAFDGIPLASAMTTQLETLRNHAPNLIKRVAVLGGITLEGEG